MLGIGFGEFALIFVVLIVVLGPERLPTFMKTVGKGLRTLRQASRDIRSAVGIDELLNDAPIYTPPRPRPRPAKGTLPAGLEGEDPAGLDLSDSGLDDLRVPANAAEAGTADKANTPDKTPDAQAGQVGAGNNPVPERQYPLPMPGTEPAATSAPAGHAKAVSQDKGRGAASTSVTAPTGTSASSADSSRAAAAPHEPSAAAQDAAAHKAAAHKKDS